jgi:hypothetical protein
VEGYPALEAARRLAEAARGPITDGDPSAVVPHLADAMDAVSSAIQAIADTTTADLPTRVWLGEAGEHAGAAAKALHGVEADPGDAARAAVASQGYDAARQLEAAAGLLACLPPRAARPLDEDGLAALVPLIGEALDELSSISFGLGDLCSAGQDEGGALTAAGEQLGECSARLSDAHYGLVKAARDARIARAAEAAWAAGTGHGRTGHPAAITRDGGAFALNGEEGASLAASLGIVPYPAGTVVTGTAAGADPAAVAASAAYCDAYAEAAGPPGAGAAIAGRYAPGQQVTTALGRTGVLTGDAGPGGRPRVRFSDGQEAAVPREAIRAPLAHVLATMGDAEGASCIADGDVLLVLSDRIIPWVQAGGSPRPACGDTASLGRRRCEYEDSVRLAEEVMGLAPGSLFGIDQHASPFDASRYNGGISPFEGCTRREIEEAWGRPPGSLRAFDYGTESHLERLAPAIARLGFPAAVAPAAPSGPRARPAREAGSPGPSRSPSP